jgi:hypothetical protein
MKPMSLRIAERKMRKPPSPAERAKLIPMARLVLEIFEKAANFDDRAKFFTKNL